MPVAQVPSESREVPFFAIPQEPFDPAALAAAEAALRTLPIETEGAKAYLEKHLPRLARTLALVPQAGPQPERVLELGCYMEITPFLQTLCGYCDVRGAYYGRRGKVERKSVRLPGGLFSCFIDLFDVERHPFPYPTGSFSVAIAGEIIEHLVYDPMFMLRECHRVLREGGRLIVSTPNIAGLASVAKLLDGRANPQIFSAYKRPVSGHPGEMGHRREYTAFELGEAVQFSGFEIESLFTTHLEEYAGHLPLLELLASHGFSTADRGEQTWCVAIKRENLPVTRFPDFLYEKP